MSLRFTKLNEGWNADPNVPDPEITMDGIDLILKFEVNAYLYPNFEKEEVGMLRFRNCSRYRLDHTNDEGWHRGQCRFSFIAPEWGEFYLITGNRELMLAPDDWVILNNQATDQSHFLFYFRDGTFECSVDRWAFANDKNNALLRIPNVSQ